MRTTLALLATMATLPAAAQPYAHEPGTGLSGPASNAASNINQSDTRSAIAPHLPQPPGGQSAGYRNYLRDAERDLHAHRTGAAQQALEMAETRLLDRSTPVGAAGQPDQSPVVAHVSQARQALAQHNLAAAEAAVHAAINGPQ